MYSTHCPAITAQGLHWKSWSHLRMPSHWGSMASPVKLGRHFFDYQASGPSLGHTWRSAWSPNARWVPYAFPNRHWRLLPESARWLPQFPAGRVCPQPLPGFHWLRLYRVQLGEWVPSHYIVASGHWLTAPFHLEETVFPMKLVAPYGAIIVTRCPLSMIFRII